MNRSSHYEPKFIDRATLSLGRAEALTEILLDFVEQIGEDFEECSRGDALIHALKLELTEVRRVLESVDAAPSPGGMQDHEPSAACQHHGDGD